MGRQQDHMSQERKVRDHLEEISMLQKVTQMAPSHGKETAHGQPLYQVSDARQALLIDHGIKRTYPLTKTS